MASRRLVADVDELTLSVRYDFSASVMKRAMTSTNDPSAAEARRTRYHETVHLYQLVTTPYGVYLAHLTDLQAWLAVVAISALREAGVPVQVPLGAYVDSLAPDDAPLAARNAVDAWHLVDLARLRLEGNVGALLRTVTTDHRTAHLAHEELFNACDRYLRAMVDSAGDVLRYWSPQPSMPLIPGPNNEGDAARMRMWFAARVAGDIDASAVLEHTAKLAEYWGREDWRAARAAVEVGTNPRYHSLGVVSLAHLGGLPLPEFLRSILAIGELALFAPLLPSQHRFRRENLTALDMHPITRFEAAARVAAELPRMRRGDVASYQEAICDRLGWPTPQSMAAAESKAVEPTGNPTLRWYWLAQQVRARRPHAFIDLDVWSLPPGVPAIDEFRARFSHPVMEFSDSQWFHKDRDMLRYLLLRFVHHKFLRAAMLSKNLDVTLPVSLAEADLQSLSADVHELMRPAGLKMPSIRIRPVPAHAAATLAPVSA